jgi:hypothetical protein
MPPFDPLLWRLAGRLAARIAPLCRHSFDIDLSPHWMVAARHLLDQIRDVTKRGWTGAADHLGWELRSRLSECQKQIQAASRMFSSGSYSSMPPSQRLIYDELVAVRTEAAEFSFDLPDETVTVYTDEITLEGIDLGRFEIRLQGRELGGTPYLVIPESPHYPNSRSDVPHPHVLGERLCEGDASAPLAHALRSGRFSDYFQIIQQTLASYNSESPYVALNAWYGYDCKSCGDSISDDESSYCDGCDATVCSDCSRCCSQCGESGCDACLPQCPQCCDDTCTNCLKRCTACSKVCCVDCLTHQLCEACHAESATNQETTDETVDEKTSKPDTIIPSHAPLPADRVGQVAVPA